MYNQTMMATTKPEPLATTMVDLTIAAQMLEVWTGDTMPETISKPLTLVLGTKGITEIRNYPNYRIIRGPGGVSFMLYQALAWRDYAQIVGLFKKVNADMMGAEALVYIWTKDGQLAITVPDQEVSGSRAEPVRRDEWLPPDDSGGWRLWAHIHSHNTMGAFFSGTDDASEQQDGILYGVIGKITDLNPESKWRLRAAGQWVEIKFEHVVEVPSTIYPEPAPTWMDRIKRFGGFHRGVTPHQSSLPVVVRDFRRMSGHAPGNDTQSPSRTGNGFRRIIRLDGTVDVFWPHDKRLTATLKRVEDLTSGERKFALVEGLDWFESETRVTHDQN